MVTCDSMCRSNNKRLRLYIKISIEFFLLKMATNYNESLTHKHPVNMNNEVSSSTSNTDSNELRDKVKILVNELKTNTVDSPDHYGWLHLRITDLSVK